MFLNLRSIFELGSLCLLIMMIIMIMMSFPSYIGTASYAQDNTTSKLNSPPPGRNVLAPANSTLGATSNNQDLESNLVAKNVENTLRDGVSALELMTNNLTPMTIPPNEVLLKTTLKTLHGIPPNADESKRELAQDIISKYKIFEYIGYLTPRGDTYFVEPYSPAQTHLQTLNFAYREHFKGAIASKGPFLSNVINN